MQTEHQNFRHRVSMRLVLSAIVFVLSAHGCANQAASTQSAATAPKAAKTTATAPNTTEQASAQQQSPAPPPPSLIEPYALNRLKQMSDNLAAAKAFTYRSNNTLELQAKTGQFLTFFADTRVALQRPDKLRADIEGDVPNFQLYFDGSKVSAFDPQKNVYAISEPLHSIDEMLSFVTTKAGMAFPSADFMHSDPYSIMTQDLTHAIVVGPTLVNGAPCEHFAYMVPGINWEIWIASGKNPLPLRLAMTYKEVKNFPRFLIEYADWNLQPKLKKDLFVFKIPAKATQIEFARSMEQMEQMEQPAK